MAILKVAQMGNPILRIPAEPVKNIQASDIHLLIDDMIETMQEYRGVGLAAPRSTGLSRSCSSRRKRMTARNRPRPPRPLS